MRASSVETNPGFQGKYPMLSMMITNIGIFEILFLVGCVVVVAAIGITVVVMKSK
jgi:hypothetical protein